MPPSNPIVLIGSSSSSEAQIASREPRCTRKAGVAPDYRARHLGAAERADLRNPAAPLLGIYSGYFRDPDGHLWEIIWNPQFDLDGD